MSRATQYGRHGADIGIGTAMMLFGVSAFSKLQAVSGRETDIYRRNFERLYVAPLVPVLPADGNGRPGSNCDYTPAICTVQHNGRGTTGVEPSILLPPNLRYLPAC